MNLESPDSGRRPPLEPVLPLINVVFLLLIFFMVAGQLAPRPEGDATAPDSASAGTEEDLEQLLLVLDTDGRLLHDGQPVDADQVAELVRDYQAEGDRKRAEEALIRQQAEAAEQQDPVRLLADAGTPLKTLRQSLDLLRDAGVEEVRLVTRSESAP
ncbi:MAG: biopolymer transporter ExbD [Alcanivorax sp.]|uniref:Biopolymer transporter ExbD n=1 Tax=Alloalcanivorax marinus TaxID=1177169 RepID=A0A9Q3UJX9_9GAMM|nr:biopolymer transporter ExbD [Alloalcanivorax marinus]MBM7335181.1 biopolymer transporter ExbD [Alloalcanivorax marinus]MCC4307223.1 biopolymer transporter ExbD [Alloalcanivorax marinus]MCU5787566.1 ferric siderophore transport system inner membrane protein E [Alloalcanivorax marinus]